jgi:hypothetical protein
MTGEKHYTFYDLKDALSRVGCPICFLAERSVARNIEDLFHEKVNDSGVAKEIKRSGGFCEKHSEQILRTGETLGIAIIYKRLLDVFIGYLKKNWVKTKLASCPICMTYQQAEQRYLSNLIDHWGELKPEFAASSILCIGHTYKALGLMKQTKTMKELVEIQIKKLGELSAELEEICRKFDYRFADEKLGKEKDAWQRATKIIFKEGKT